MVQILERPPSFGEQLSRGFGGGLGSGIAQGAQLAQQMELEKHKAKSLAGATKQLEKVKLMEGALDTVGRMRELLSSAGPSNYISGLFPGETQRSRGELARLGTSLISLVSQGVTIRNQKEFETFSKVITDPNSNQSELEGALDAIQRILERGGESSESSPKRSEMSSEKPVFDPSNASHKKTRDALMKKYGDSREKVQRELEKHFRE